jgi:hypothetical protein
MSGDIDFGQHLEAYSSTSATSLKLAPPLTVREAAVWRSMCAPVRRPSGMPARTRLRCKDRADHRGLEGPGWIGEGQEHPALPMLWAAVPEIFGQRGADLLGQRQHPLVAALPGAQAKLPRTPIQVVKFEGGDLTGAQAQTGQQREDRPVTIRRRTRLGRTLQQPCELLRGEVCRQAGVRTRKCVLRTLDQNGSEPCRCRQDVRRRGRDASEAYFYGLRTDTPDQQQRC